MDNEKGLSHDNAPQPAECALKEQEPKRRCSSCEHRKVIRGRRGNRFLCKFTGKWLGK